MNGTDRTTFPWQEVMSKQLKALEKIELVNARERSLAFKREVVRAELTEKMERAAEVKEQRARLAEAG